MITCEMMTDRMPEVAAGASAWSPDERAHLQGCEHCTAEWRLVRIARHLRTPVVERFDAEAVSRGVLTRLRDARRRRWRMTGGWLVGLAAAAAVVLMVRTGQEPTVTRPEQETGFVLPQAELERLDEAQLEQVLDLLGGPLGEGAGDPGPSMDDLNDQQLERVLRSLEG